MYRIYRHNARRRWVRTVIRQQQPSPVEIKEWYDHLWEGLCTIWDKGQSILLAGESALTACLSAVWSKAGRPALKGLLALSMFPFMIFYLVVIASEWLKVWASMDSEAKVETISNGIGLACNAFVSVMDAASAASRQFLCQCIVFCFKALVGSIRFVIVTTFQIVRFTVEALCSGVALLVRLFFGSFSVSGRLVGTVFEKCIAGIGTSYQPVVKGFDQVVGYLGQASSSAGNWTKRLFSKLLPKKHRWQQQQDTELLAGLKQEPHSKKGKSRKALKGKQQQKQKQQPQRKGGPTFLPSPATGSGMSSPRLFVSADAQSEHTSAFPGAAAPFDDSDSASPVIGARKAAGLPAKPASNSPVKTNFAIDATSNKASFDVDAHSEAGSNPDAEMLKSDSSQGDMASVRAVSSSPSKADSSVPAKPATAPSRATVATPSQSQDNPVTATSPSVLPAKADVSPANSETVKLETIQAVNRVSGKGNAKATPKSASVSPISDRSHQSTPFVSEVNGKAGPQPKGQFPQPQEAGQLPAPPKPRKRTQAVHKPKAAVAAANPDAKKVATLADPKPVKGSAALPQGEPAEPQMPAQTLPTSPPESSQPAQGELLHIWSLAQNLHVKLGSFWSSNNNNNNNHNHNHHHNHHHHHHHNHHNNHNSNNAFQGVVCEQDLAFESPQAMRRCPPACHFTCLSR